MDGTYKTYKIVQGGGNPELMNIEPTYFLNGPYEIRIMFNFYSILELFQAWKLVTAFPSGKIDLPE